MADKVDTQPHEATLLDCIDRLNLLRGAYMHKMMTETGLHFRQIPILGFVEHCAGCTQNELAQAMGLSPSSIALSTKRLEKSGFLYKRTDAENLRCKRLYLSAKGQSAYRAARQGTQDFYRELMRGIKDDQARQVEDILKSMIFNLSGECSVGFLENIALFNASKCEKDGAESYKEESVF